MVHSAEKPVAFLLSGGRTGTVAIAQYFANAYPEMRSVNEPAQPWQMRIASNMFLAGRLDMQGMEKLLWRWRVREIERAPIGGYLESNASLWGFGSVIPQVFPEARIIHVVRDLRAYVRSVINFGSFSGRKAVANICVPYWIPGRESRDGPRIRLSGLTVYEQAAWLWTIMNREIADSCEGESRYDRVRFEDLFRDDGRGLVRLAEHIGCSPPEAVLRPFAKGAVNASHGQKVPKWGMLSEGVRDSVLRIGGSQMARFGYE